MIFTDYNGYALEKSITYVIDRMRNSVTQFATATFNSNDVWYLLMAYIEGNGRASGIVKDAYGAHMYNMWRWEGADAVLKKLGSNIVYIGNSTSIDVKTVLPNDYANLTVDNFVVELASLSANGGAANTGGASYPQFGSVNANSNMTKAYNNGVLTIQGIACSGETYDGDRTWRRYVSASAGIRVYAVY